MTAVLLLVPSDPLRPRKPDPHFADEWEAARALGADVGLIDHDALQRAQDGEHARDAAPRVPPSSDAVYRGWMVTARQYGLLEDALLARDVRLRTSAGQYRRAHELPGWHAALSSSTPEACWTVGADLAAFVGCLRRLRSGAAVLRDYTKSLKHHWHEAALVPDVGDEVAATRVAERFAELRGDAFDGGFVLRRFESFVGAERRTWWVEGRHLLTTAHPDTPHEHAPVPDDVTTALAPAVGALGLPFVSVDLVLRADGRWRVVELGDGQVSDRPGTCPAERLVEVLVPRP